MNWKEIYKHQRNTEIIIICTATIILISAVVSEIFVAYGKCLFVIENFDTIASVIVQIQATVQSLTIALLALTSGRMNESYMGINQNNFQFNIKPIFLKQKRLVIASLCLLIINVFSVIWGCYNAVTALFIISCMLVLVLTRQVYAVFSGTVNCEEEIKEYLVETIQNGKLEEKRKKLFEDFASEWRKKICFQSNSEYEQYSYIFDLFLKIAILQDVRPLQMGIQEETAKLIAELDKTADQKSRAIPHRKKAMQKSREYGIIKLWTSR